MNAEDLRVGYYYKIKGKAVKMDGSTAADALRKTYGLTVERIPITKTLLDRLNFNLGRESFFQLTDSICLFLKSNEIGYEPTIEQSPINPKDLYDQIILPKIEYIDQLEDIFRCFNQKIEL